MLYFTLYIHSVIHSNSYFLLFNMWFALFAVLFRLCSPEKTRTVLPEHYIFSNGPTGDGQCTPQVPQPASNSSPSREQLVLYVPEMEEIRISPVVARKGYLNILEQKTNGWKKRWVVRIAVEDCFPLPLHGW
jgi:hypothetical protein